MAAQQGLLTVVELTGLQLVGDGYAFVEGLRWHHNQLWFSDFHLHQVFATALDGSTRVAYRMPDDSPSGLGWLPDGRLLAVAMHSQTVRRAEGAEFVVHSTLGSIATGPCNDMVVDHLGRAYVGNHGGPAKVQRDNRGRYFIVEPSPPAYLALVLPDGTARRACETPLAFPNGMAISADGHLLIVAETIGRRISAFDIADDGSLRHHRVFAEVDGFPDGICLDAEGAIWFADTDRGACFRVREGGEHTHRIATERTPFSCALGGPTSSQLFIASGDLGSPQLQRQRRIGRIDVIDVEIPAV